MLLPPGLVLSRRHLRRPRRRLRRSRRPQNSRKFALFGAGDPSRTRAYVHVRTRSTPSLPGTGSSSLQEGPDVALAEHGGSSLRTHGRLHPPYILNVLGDLESTRKPRNPSTRARRIAGTDICASSMPSTSSTTSKATAARVNRAKELVAHVCSRIAPAQARRWRLRALPPSSANCLLRLAATFLVYGVLASPRSRKIVAQRPSVRVSAHACPSAASAYVHLPPAILSPFHGGLDASQRRVHVYP
ncbi:hypothetical protein VTO73DRAFT_7125 [Trametes versicolor]